MLMQSHLPFAFILYPSAYQFFNCLVLCLFVFIFALLNCNACASVSLRIIAPVVLVYVYNSIVFVVCKEEMVLYFRHTNQGEAHVLHSRRASGFRDTTPGTNIMFGSESNMAWALPQDLEQLD